MATMTTVITDKAEEFLLRLKTDKGARANFERDPFAALRAAGIELPESVLSSEVRIVGEGDELSICFVLGDIDLDWPIRNYFLENKTGSELYLESWQNERSKREQEVKKSVPLHTTGFFAFAALDEIKQPPRCNLHKNSHLVRHPALGKLKESDDCTCGPSLNYWIATETGGKIALVESHPEARIGSIQAYNEMYVCVDRDHGDKVVVDRNTIGLWEKFLMVERKVEQEGTIVTFMTTHGHFLCAENGGGSEIVADRAVSGDWERFRFHPLGGNKFSLQAHNGQYVSAENGGGGRLLATSTTVGPFETFTLK